MSRIPAPPLDDEDWPSSSSNDDFSSDDANDAIIHSPRLPKSAVPSHEALETHENSESSEWEFTEVESSDDAPAQPQQPLTTVPAQQSRHDKQFQSDITDDSLSDSSVDNQPTNVQSSSSKQPSAKSSMITPAHLPCGCRCYCTKQHQPATLSLSQQTSSRLYRIAAYFSTFQSSHLLPCCDNCETDSADQVCYQCDEFHCDLCAKFLHLRHSRKTSHQRQKASTFLHDFTQQTSPHATTITVPFSPSDVVTNFVQFPPEYHQQVQSTMVAVTSTATPTATSTAHPHIPPPPSAQPILLESPSSTAHISSLKQATTTTTAQQIAPPASDPQDETRRLAKQANLDYAREQRRAEREERRAHREERKKEKERKAKLIVLDDDAIGVAVDADELPTLEGAIHIIKKKSTKKKSVKKTTHHESSDSDMPPPVSSTHKRAAVQKTAHQPQDVPPPKLKSTKVKKALPQPSSDDNDDEEIENDEDFLAKRFGSRAGKKSSGMF